ncbi:flagellar biosynthesis protein [Sphingobium sp. DEHP117]|uniref:FliH/SctL family protein n=1 Tax=Sphingobium sp. DEHP117 TaxID=2993436 RepID=UPI0027D5A47B|nr:flagellar biosynthesis protein [Sphingobium sp. DEHP117]MDQ4419578.1 flagellar biosynthesis protein [Sphingobium sp. DEHP117]
MFTPAQIGEAQPVSIGMLGNAAAGTPFRARFADGQEVSHTRPASSPAQGRQDPLEQARADAFAEGFDAGMRIAGENHAADTEASARLAQALEQIVPAANGALSEMLSVAVSRLVSQIVGEAPVNAELLHQRVEAVAAFIEDEQARTALCLNPEDIPLLGGREVAWRIQPDASVARGCVRLDAGDGWIEHGPDVQLSRLKALLDDMEGQG